MKTFSFFFYLLAHSSLMIVYILLKILKSVEKHLPQGNLHPTETNQSIYIKNQLSGFLWNEPSM